MSRRPATTPEPHLWKTGKPESSWRWSIIYTMHQSASTCFQLLILYTTSMFPLIDRSVCLWDVCGGDGPYWPWICGPIDHPVGIMSNSNMLKKSQIIVSIHDLLHLSRTLGQMISRYDPINILFCPFWIFNNWRCKAGRVRSNCPVIEMG